MSMILMILDLLISCFCMCPLGIIFWWGCFEYEIYSKKFPDWWTLYVSSTMEIVFTLLRDVLYDNRKSGLLGLCISRVYIYFYGIICISKFKSLFLLIGRLSLQLIFISSAVSVLLLSYFRSLGTLVGPPYFLYMDHKRKQVFIYPTMFKKAQMEWRGDLSRLSIITSMRGSTAGITDGLRGTSSTYYHFVTCLDSFLSAVLISPLVVSYWRGTWELMAFYVYPNSLKKSSLVSLFIGLVGIMLFTLTQKCYRKILNPNKHRISYYVVSRIYTACFGFVCVNSWRGAWVALDAYTFTDNWSITQVTLVSVAILIGTKTLRNISAPPFAIVTDRYEGYFDVPTVFKTSTENIWIYLLDCVFSVCVIGMLVVFVWRGFWTMLDTHLYPNDLVYSTWMSVGIGYAIVAVTFALQPAIKYLATELSGVPRMAAVDIYLLFSFCGTVNVWRGIWNLLDIYFLSNEPEMSYALSHFGSFVFLVLINSSNSVLVRGVYIDGEEAGSQCVDFPCYYLRLFFQSKKKRKLIKEAEKRSEIDPNSREGEVLIQVGANPTIEPSKKNISSNNLSSLELNQH